MGGSHVHKVVSLCVCQSGSMCKCIPLCVCGCICLDESTSYKKALHCLDTFQASCQMAFG